MSRITLNSTSPEQPGQLRVRTDGGATYITTEVVPGEATASTTASTATMSGTRSLSLTSRPIEIPQGFATDVGVLINSLLSFVMVLSALLVFFFLVMGAFDWILSGGDKGKTEKARSKILAAIVGIVIVAASFAILTLVVRFLGFENLDAVLNNVKGISS
jgi:hypothetical protein